MPLSAEDQLAIMNLLARYNHSIDFGEPEEWADCFTGDGEFDARPVGSCKGREELVAFASGIKARRTGGAGDTRHWNDNVLIEGDGNEATTCFYLMSVAAGTQARVGVTGRYSDRLVKRDGVWKIKHRGLVFDDPPAAS